ncbi:Cas10/Cmr2 second palm domain-containing protein [Iningainema tapete]|uniref:CRISPR-associated protein Cmr2 n=1 Tax=Iningainema tapete BLCC-T55 TaxID=2748662 RepID=A0A8J6XS33_9CYAN|nr:type III-B CRISPR-associated protein Cas10/Cmr2 [Iningainema tapete]MBD2772618.1 CRISPR-associated protein Cmr2 [Iningainema tapete BLCC-T55]
MPKYTAITFSPVQGFIEKSRKLRDLYGASQLLSHLSRELVEAALKSKVEVISPGLIEVEKGMPNRILLNGEFSEEQTRKALLEAWKNVLDVCRVWVEDNLREFRPYHWDREWRNWVNYSWEIFWGQGNSIPEAMQDLETLKLSRDWIAINWIGESSSLTGTDAIAWPGLGAETRNPQYIKYSDEKLYMEKFYEQLAGIIENSEEPKPEGKFIALNEKLSIPELVKRLVTLPKIAGRIGIQEPLEEGFREIERKPTKDTPGQWTGWFMGDGDRVGKHLKEVAQTQGDEGIKNFTHAMRSWGKDFSDNFPKDKGRVIYAGGDDFLGVIYSNNPAKPISPLTAFEWLMTLPKQWEKHKQDITLSVGCVWVAGSVPQRDVLQHCRDAEKRSKLLDRNRVTIRVVFNSGQYLQWTCPWNYLHIVKKYCDRDGKTYAKWECSGRDPNQKPNWSHVYNDLAQLKARHAINFDTDEDVDERLALALFNIYFNDKAYLEDNCEYIVGKYSSKDLPKQLIRWINDLINVGWQLCSNT